MGTIEYRYWEAPVWTQHLVGKSIINADVDKGELTLSDGTVMRFDKSNSDCCSSIELMDMSTTGNIITAATVADDSHGQGDYKAWVEVITKSGIHRVVEADGDASNGYYLDGFALGVVVVEPDSPTAEELDAAIQSIMGDKE